MGCKQKSTLYVCHGEDQHNKERNLIESGDFVYGRNPVLRIKHWSAYRCDAFFAGHLHLIGGFRDLGLDNGRRLSKLVRRRDLGRQKNNIPQ